MAKEMTNQQKKRGYEKINNKKKIQITEKEHKRNFPWG